jgi:hypothetical protein
VRVYRIAMIDRTTQPKESAYQSDEITEVVDNYFAPSAPVVEPVRRG